jgi:hypothetical protein
MFSLDKKSRVLTLLIAFALNYLICYPGFFTIDSYVQFRESISLNLSNHHPPLLSIIWHYLNFIQQGPQLMLALNLAMIWLSVFLLTECFSQKYPKACLLTLLMPFTPAILGNSAIIWKDVLLGNTVLLSIAITIYLHYRQSSSPARGLAFTLTLILLFIGTTVKFQGKFIAPLILLLMTFLILRKSFRFSILIALLMSFAFHGASQMINNSFKVADTKSEQLRQFFDIAGISICLDRDLMPDYAKEDKRYSFEKVKALYLPAFVNPYIGSDEKTIYKPTQEAEKLAALQSTFFNTALSHPLCYLQHRMGTFFRMERSGTFTFKSCDDLSISSNESTKALCNFENNFYVNYVEAYVSNFKFLSRNYLFLLVNIVFLIFGLRCYKRFNPEGKSLVLINSYISITCIAFALIMFFTTMAADHRYLYLVRVVTSIFLPLQIALLLQFSTRPKSKTRNLQSKLN